jgi:hypothetical protein
MAMVCVLAVGFLAGCGGSKKKVAVKTRPQVTIEARNFQFVLPDQMPAGWVDVSLLNASDQDHQIAFVKLGSLSFAKFKRAMTTMNFKGLPADTVFVGGPNGVAPLAKLTVTVHLEPGTYGVVCFLPDPKDGKSHAAKGMVGQVEVTPNIFTVEEPPDASGGKIDMTEFDFLVDPAFKGVGTVAFNNVGTQVHETAIFKIAEGKTLADVKKFLFVAPGKKPPAGPPPFTSIGGVVGVGPRQTAYEPLILATGKYALVCFFPDPTKKNTPHALEGMIKEITIS